MKKIRQDKKIVIWDEVMWRAYVDPNEINMVEYHVGEGLSEEDEPAPKKFKNII